MIELVVVNPEQQHERFQFDSGPIELGRENPRTIPRVVVNDRFTSRHQVLIDDAADGQLRVENITDNPGRPVRISNGIILTNGEKAFVTPPVRLFFGKTTVDLQCGEEPTQLEASLQSIQRTILAPSAATPQHTILASHDPPATQRLTEWFETLLSVQRAAAGSEEFFQETARAVVETIGLDRGLVLVREGHEWRARAAFSRNDEDRGGFSRRILDRAAGQKNTIFQNFGAGSGLDSLLNVQAVVASPVFNAADEVIGAVYGSRDIRPTVTTGGVRLLEAQFVQVLAGMVGAGLIRAAREAETARMRVQFEGFFSKPLAQALERDRTLLDARQRELTMLFLDLRGFSKIAERTEPGETYPFLSDCLNRFTETVMNHDGVVIDYYGDGFAAMWNAPLDQPNHAELAVRSALQMLTLVPALNEQYSARLGAAVNVGIGVHTGWAQVGNSGSKFRLKYGPRGHSVNLTSRTESATKVVGIACLITRSTRACLPAVIEVRRICCARLPGMHEAIDLFELGGTDPSDAWLKLRGDYETALTKYEQGAHHECLELCERICAENPAPDPAALWLAGQSRQRIATGDSTPQPIVEFTKG